MASKRVLALDVSGSATGWAFGVNHSLKEWGKHISNLRRSKGERLYIFSEWLDELLRRLKPNVIVIEKPYLGRNSKVLANLSKFIAVVELKAHEVSGISIDDDCFIDPKTIKKYMKVSSSRKTSRVRYEDNKAKMVKRVNHLYGLSLKYASGKSKKFNDDDIADSIAVWATWLALEEEED